MDPSRSVSNLKDALPNPSICRTHCSHKAMSCGIGLLNDKERRWDQLLQMDFHALENVVWRSDSRKLRT